MILRALEPEDLSQLRDWRNSEELRPIFREHRLLNMINQHDWLEHVSRSYEVEMFGIVVEGLVGACGLCNIDWVNRTAEVSIYISTGPYGLELKLEVMDLLIDKAFEEFNLHRLWAEVYEFNTTNIELFEATGFKREGVLCEHVFKQGKYYNCLMYGFINRRRCSS